MRLPLPATGMNHNAEVALFALRCLVYSLTHPERKKAS